MKPSSRPASLNNLLKTYSNPHYHPHATLTLSCHLLELHALSDSAQRESGPAQRQPEAFARPTTTTGLFQQAIERPHPGSPTTFQQHPTRTSAAPERQASPAPSARPQPRHRRHSRPLGGGATQAATHIASGCGRQRATRHARQELQPAGGAEPAIPADLARRLVGERARSTYQNGLAGWSAAKSDAEAAGRSRPSTAARRARSVEGGANEAAHSAASSSSHVAAPSSTPGWAWLSVAAHSAEAGAGGSHKQCTSMLTSTCT